jgi:hypothetical protein
MIDYKYYTYYNFSYYLPQVATNLIIYYIVNNKYESYR